MQFLAILGLVMLVGSSVARGGARPSSRTSRRSTTTTRAGEIGALDPAAAALRSWQAANLVTARDVIDRWLAAPGRTAVQAGTFARELQQRGASDTRAGVDGLGDYAIDVWNTMHASG